MQFDSGPLFSGKNFKLHKAALQWSVEYSNSPGGPQAYEFKRFNIRGNKPCFIAGIFSFQGIADHFIKRNGIIKFYTFIVWRIADDESLIDGGYRFLKRDLLQHDLLLKAGEPDIFQG